MNFIDTHAHLNFSNFAQNYKEVIERARKSGVRAIINVGTSEKSSKKAIEIAHEYDKGVYASVSLHPIYAHKKFDYQAMKKLAEDKKVIAIGETGLDYHYDSENRERKKEVFRQILKLGQELEKPFIFHCREARDDFISEIKKYAPFFKSGRLRGVMHCFPGDWNFAKEVLDLGLAISYTGLITFTKREDQLEAVRKIPLERLMIETDCPFMAPEPYRGKTNEPRYVIEIAKKIAELKNISLEKVADQTTKNAMEFFKIQLFDSDSAVAQ